MILEKALSEDASQENLDRYLPSIREIIVNLLRQLKQKQSLIRSNRSVSSSSQKSAAAAVVAAAGAAGSQQYPPPAPSHHQHTPSQNHYSHQHLSHGQHPSSYGQQPPHPPPPHKGPPPHSSSNKPNNTPRSESLRSTGSSSRQPSNDSTVTAGAKGSRHGSSGSEQSSEMTQVPSNEQYHRPPSRKKSSSLEQQEQQQQNYPPPQSPTKSQSRYNRGINNYIPRQSSTNGAPPENNNNNNPLAALQRGEALERRASRRFSAYQFAKLTNGTQGARDAVPDLPPLPASPESSSNRNSYLPTKAPQSSSPAEYTSSNLATDPVGGPDNDQLDGVVNTTAGPGKWNVTQEPPQTEIAQDTSNTGQINIFLQIGRKVKKTVVERSDVTIPALRLLFIDKFAYSPGADSFPDIYIQDPQSGVRYELDEKSLDDLHAGSLLSLNIEEMDEVKKYIDEGLSGIAKSISELNSKIEQNGTPVVTNTNNEENDASTTQRGIGENNNMNDQQATTSEQKEDGDISNNKARLSKISMKQVDALRHEMSIVRQIGGTALNDFRDQAAMIMKKVQTLQSSVSLPNPGGGSRTYMESCHKKLSGDTDYLLTNVDDLQDIIEGLRKDVAQRGVRPPIRQLESVSKEMQQAAKDLEKMEKYINSERPGWKKIWERELDTICEEQQFFKLQEELVADLQDDLQKATETFSLVEQCSVEQTKSMRKNQTIVTPAPVDGIVHAKDAVLSEVSALQPNHEQRLEAIERAEKLRKKELEMRGQDEFEEELGEFVEENKLKKSGGVEETERRRKLREQKVLEEQRKNDEEAQAIREAEREKKREEKDKKKKDKKKDKDGSKDKDKKRKKDKDKQRSDKLDKELPPEPIAEEEEEELKAVEPLSSVNNNNIQGDKNDDNELKEDNNNDPPSDENYISADDDENDWQEPAEINDISETGDDTGKLPHFESHSTTLEDEVRDKQSINEKVNDNTSTNGIPNSVSEPLNDNEKEYDLQKQDDENNLL